MKRKVIKQGTDSYTVTLPREWIKSHKLIGGSEITLEEVNGDLVLSSQKVIKEKSTVISLPKELYHTTLWNLVVSAYVAGYQEIVLKPTVQSCIHIDRVTYEKKKVPLAKALDEAMTVLIGMEILVQTKEKIIIREIATGNPDLFSSTLNRSFYVLSVILDECVAEFTAKKRKELLESYFVSGSIRKLYLYCLRLLQVYGFQQQEKTVFATRLVTSLEELVNQLKIIIHPSTKLSQADIDSLRKLKEFLQQTRSSLQKKDVFALTVLMQEVKEKRIMFHNKPLKAVFDSVNAVVQNCFELVL